MPYNESEVMRFVQHRILGLWKGDTLGTFLHLVAFQTTGIKLIVQEVPGQLEVPSGAETEMPTATRLCWSFTMSPQGSKT